MKRILAFLYGVVCYTIFVCTFVYAMGFVSNLFVPRSIDSLRAAPLGEALVVNALLLGLFAVQHSLMARQGFKRLWTRIVAPPVERSTYVLFSSLALILLFWKWEPIGGVVWNVADPGARFALQALSVVGFGIALMSSFLINHFDLFGLRQVYLYLRGRPYTPLGFRTRTVYKYVRHPLYLGFLIAFWSTPTMTIAHLVFALATAGYILVGIQLEERDMVEMHGEKYEAYRSQVSMLIPRPPKRTGLQPGRSAQ
ncbi:MAG TPA: isoprenylcysteine carboxylmethyltransferase family protein [Myxococcales bacterium]|jgi:protein-S-isoprenylcysteine O-methyltransferase Ste14|nr:isoprenylcysteine carboxylmethyltransferase family protein [Myxococcales bacterium]